jgi:hypothetical protein
MRDDRPAGPTEVAIEVVQDPGQPGGVAPFELGEPQLETPGAEAPSPLPTEAAEIVERTGIALVHAGEYILPASGSEAVIAAATDSGSSGHVVNYYFPVEIEVVGGLSEEQLRVCADFVYDELLAASRARIA